LGKRAKSNKEKESGEKESGEEKKRADFVQISGACSADPRQQDRTSCTVIFSSGRTEKGSSTENNTSW
jgi:hypothetical protein